MSGNYWRLRTRRSDDLASSRPSPGANNELDDCLPWMTIASRSPSHQPSLPLASTVRRPLRRRAGVRRTCRDAAHNGSRNKLLPRSAHHHKRSYFLRRRWRFCRRNRRWRDPCGAIRCHTCRSFSSPGHHDRQRQGCAALRYSAFTAPASAAIVASAIFCISSPCRTAAPARSAAVMKVVSASSSRVAPACRAWRVWTSRQ